MKVHLAKVLRLVVFFLLSFTLSETCAQRLYEVDLAKAGAIADGETDNAVLLQSVINRVSTRGGGRVVIPPGNFMTGPIEMKSGVDLHLKKGARLLGPH
jgi:polygalacturonase